MMQSGINRMMSSRSAKVLGFVMFICFALMHTEKASAQSEPEYLMEIGGGVGMMSYEGDFNGSVLKCMQPSAAIVLRRLLNPRQGFKMQLGYGKLKGGPEDNVTVYPDYNTQGYKPAEPLDGRFSNSLFDLCGTYEYNFWPYGTGREYRGAKRFTPFIAMGLGFTFVTGNNNAFTVNAPIGVGVKYKIGPRLNLNVDWTMHFTMSDKLDGVKDPYRVETSGLFKNSDCYSQFQVSITYSFKEKCRVCHNSDE